MVGTNHRLVINNNTNNNTEVPKRVFINGKCYTITLDTNLEKIKNKLVISDSVINASLKNLVDFTGFFSKVWINEYYSEGYSVFINSIWDYSNDLAYFNENVICDPEYYLSSDSLNELSLESLSKCSSKKFILGGFLIDSLLFKLVRINKRRINTIFNKLDKISIFSATPLKDLNIFILQKFQVIEYSEIINLDNVVIDDSLDNKTINHYTEMLPLIALLSKEEVVMDEYSYNYLDSFTTNVNNSRGLVINPKDSMEYMKYSDIPFNKDQEVIFASEKYYLFEPNDQIKKIDLSNTNTISNDIIKTFVKLKLFDLEVKTCQLCTPSSPKDRSKKINSLSNKISSSDYRCEVTCEIFKNHTIGVVVWTDFFSNKLDLDYSSLKNNIYVYQTTSGTWKYCTIN